MRNEAQVNLLGVNCDSIIEIDATEETSHAVQHIDLADPQSS